MKKKKIYNKENECCWTEKRGFWQVEEKEKQAVAAKERRKLQNDNGEKNNAEKIMQKKTWQSCVTGKIDMSWGK